MTWSHALGNSVELIEHLRDGAVDPVQRLVNEDTLADRYKAGDCGLHLHCTIRVHARPEIGDVKIRKFCADLNWLVPSGAETRAEDVASGRFIDDTAPEIGREKQHWMDVPVLIDVRELREEGEGMVSRPIPSVVRLVPSDDCLMYVPDAGESATGKFGVVLSERLSDGELYLALIPGREVRLRTSLHQQPRDVKEIIRVASSSRSREAR